jgi:hypothetical protein
VRFSCGFGGEEGGGGGGREEEKDLRWSVDIRDDGMRSSGRNGARVGGLCVYLRTCACSLIAVELLFLFLGAILAIYFTYYV